MRTVDVAASVKELYESAEPFLSVYPNYDLSSLPRWVQENIENARV